jgi:nitrite reductase/ring-hydroxylating ferredoxin subunit
MSSAAFVRALPLSELRRGSMRAVQVGNRELVICHTRDGEVFALDNICTHAFTRMSEGRLRGDRLICPLHGASFDVRNGSVLAGPATQPLRSHEARIAAGIVEVKILI